DDLGVSSASGECESRSPGTRTKIKSARRRRLDPFECRIVGRVGRVRIANRVPLRREAVELEPEHRPQQEPEPRPAHDDVRRQPGKPPRQALKVHTAWRRILTSCPGAAPNSSAALPPLIASAMFR